MDPVVAICKQQNITEANESKDNRMWLNTHTISGLCHPCWCRRLEHTIKEMSTFFYEHWQFAGLTLTHDVK